MQIAPGGGIDASTFNGGLTITNQGDVAIDSVSFDLSTAILPDMVFDPVGSAGDATGLCLVPVTGSATTGYVTPGDNCVDPFSQPHDADPDDGYDVATVTFTDFGPGETFEFKVDIDPTSIKNAPGTGNAGSVSGLELTGSTITVDFADGQLTGETYRIDGSASGSEVVVHAIQPEMPTIDALGVNEEETTLSPQHTAATVISAAQIIEVAGPVGAQVSLLQLDSALVQQPGYDIEDYEANKAVAVNEYDAVIGATGTVAIPVTLTDTAAEEDPNESGLNYFVAVVEDGDVTGPNSNIIILKLEAANQAPVAVDDVATVEVGGSVDIPVLANDTDADGTLDPTTVTITSGPSGGTANVDPATGVVTYNAEAGAETAGSDSFSYTVADDDGEISNEATVTITVTPETADVSLYRINAGGPLYVDSDGDTWLADSFFTGGQVYSTTEPIANTEDDPLYQTERYGADFSYSFPVTTTGTYTVDLHLAEIFVGAPGSGSEKGQGDRIFDVIIEGTTVLDDYDLFADVGALTATIKSFQTEVTDGILNIQFTATVDNAKISAIEILGPPGDEPPPPPPPTGGTLYRVNSGGPLVEATDGGPDWTMDTTADPSLFLINQGSNTTSNHGTVGSVDDSVPASTPTPVFTTERWDDTTDPKGEMAYAFPVTAGTQVEVRLYFRNGFDGTDQPGDRVFDVVLDGATVLNDYDIVADVGHDVGTMKDFSVTSDGTIDIEFLHEVENPLINAIEILVDEPQANQLGASPSNVGFGNVVIGNTTNDTVTITNLGEAGDPDITVNSVDILNDASGEFAATLNGSTTIAPGESRTIDVSFSPADAGAESATLEITHTGSNSPVQIGLSGDGVSDIPVGFGSSGLSGVSTNNPTSLQFGPDDRLYVSQQNGTLTAYTVERNGANDYSTTSTETINLVKNLPNHNDDGALNSSITTRQVTGLVVTGTASNPVLYVSSSDSRIGGGGGGGDQNLDTNSGVISRLTWNGASWDHVAMVRGLPRSEENHSTNGLDLDEANNTLYVAQGGHANKGAPSNNFAQTPEYALSAAVLSIDLTALQAMTVKTDGEGTDYIYDLPTLDDPERTNEVDGSDPGDPFGGNDGRNQARITAGSPVQVYSPGFRNPYDVLLSEDGQLYTWDNGPNTGWGGIPVGEGPDGSCTNQTNEDNSNSIGDGLHYISGPGYYGGHPNPTRANPDADLYIYEKPSGNWVLVEQYDFQTDFPQPPVPAGMYDPEQCDYQVPDNALHLIGASTNGLTEYTASNFGGEMTGDLLAASFNGNIYRAQLNADGSDVTDVDPIFSGFGSQPLDVTAQADNQVFPGTVWAATYGADVITVFEPNDYDGGSGGGGGPGGGTCTGTDDPNIDEDSDGFSNADEIDNGTDPCSGGSKPDDNDGDNVSDLNDPDDDNDNIDDVDDAFAIDPDNGTTTQLPVDYPFFNNEPGTGFFGLGFTGLMINGTTDYLEQFDEDQIAAGGAAGLFTVEEVTAGDAYQAVNTQDNGFQYGVDVDSTTDPFVVHTRLSPPYFAIDGNQTNPVNYQSYGLFVGTGDQDNYLKVVFAPNDGVQVLLETAGATVSNNYPPSVTGDLLGSSQVDLYVAVDPTTMLAQPRVSIDGGTTVVDLGNPVAVPASWLNPTDEMGLAVGVISTSTGPGAPFSATWDFLNVALEEETATPGTGQASIAITPSSGINASTYGSGSFSVTNDAAVPIESITFDLSTALFPDLVFDPDGTAGDTTAKGFSADSGEAATGQTTHAFTDPHNGVDGGDGYDTLTVNFDDFGIGETFAFSVDNDPTSIKGATAPGPNQAGSVSGLELVGSTVTVAYSDGTAVTVNPFSDGSDGGSDVVAAAGLPGPPGIDLVGAPENVATVTDPNQTVTVSADDGDTVQLLRVEAGLFLSGDGYDVDAYEANSAVDVELLAEVTVGNDGTVDIPVTLTRTSDDSDLNHLVAVEKDDLGRTGATSEVLIIEYDPAATTSTVAYRLNTGGSELAAEDGGPFWEADPGAGGSTYLVAGGGNTYNTSDTITLDGSVPASTPTALFQSERYDPAAAPEMLYEFGVTAGETYEVRLYFAEIFQTTDGTRIFDVTVEDAVAVDDLDQHAMWGHDKGGMLSTQVTPSDGTLSIEFIHDVENPAIKGIEILQVG